MNQQKLLTLGFGLCALPIFFLFNKIFMEVWLRFDQLQGGFYYPLSDTFAIPPTLLALVFYVLSVVGLLRYPKTRTFGTEVIVELKKVTWPTLEETKSSTWVVLAVCLFFAVFFGAVDYIFGNFVRWALKF